MTISDIILTLEHINNEGVKTGSICRVPEKIRDANKEKSEEWYRPKFVAIGPIHRGATIDLQTMELTKWRYTDKLLSRHRTGKDYLISENYNRIKGLESIIRGSYGDTIHMGTEEFARNMFLDACFLVELFLRLSENATLPSVLGYIDDDKKISRLLTDLMLLENQVPFFLLTILTANPFLIELEEEDACTPFSQLNPKRFPLILALRFFDCNFAVVDLPNDDVCHFLHLIHLCYPDPYRYQDILRNHPLQLHRCAGKLQAFGIRIRPCPKLDEDFKTRKFMDMFVMEIKFDEKRRDLMIPTLHIKEATEVRWRNFIAWEQIGGMIGVGYKFTSYAYFFKGLVCSVHDVQLLRKAEVIKVHTEANDEDLLIMFQSIATGAKQLDGRYSDLCEALNKANVKGVAGWCVVILRMAWHYWRRFQEWLQLGLISMLLSFIDTYLGTPWKFIGVVSGLALLVLTIMQTIYAARSSH